MTYGVGFIVPGLVLLATANSGGAAEPESPFLPSGARFRLVPDAGPWLPKAYDFETPPDPAELRVAGVRTTDPALVLDGSASLLIDTRPYASEWNEFIHTATGVYIEPGRTYRVGLDYRAIDNADASLYAVLRSASLGPNDEADVYAPQWRGILGRRERHDLLLAPRDFADYYLLLGLRGRGAAVIDNLTIDVVPGYFAGQDDPIAARRSFDRAVLDYLEERRAADGMPDVVDDVLVILCNEGAGHKVRDARHQIVAQLRPDWVDWNPCGPLGADYGIRTTGSHAEYQELYTVEAGDVWERRYELFLHDGFVREVGGNTFTSSEWAAGGYRMCHNAPGWHEWQGASLLSALEWAEGLCQDNIAVASHLSSRGCFCRACQRKFRDWLAARYPAENLASWGIDDLSAFDIRERWLACGTQGEYGLRDPVAREFILFQNRSQREAWGDLVVRAKNLGRARDMLVPIGGNQIWVDGFWAYTATLSPYNDFIEVEELVSVRDAVDNTSWMYRMGAASGYHERPVWVRGPVTRLDPATGDDLKEPVLDPFYWTVHLGEALAQGGVRVLSLGTNRPWAGQPWARHYVDSPELMECFARYSTMVRADRAVFARTQSTARVGVIYSMPTAVWRQFLALGSYWNQPHVDAVRELSRALDREHVPHDAVILGHPDLWDDGPALAQLSSYDCLLLAEVDCLSDRQLEALRGAVAGGTVVLASGERQATRNDNFDLVRSAADLPFMPLQGNEELLRKWRIVTDAPSDVVVSVRTIAGGAGLAVHLVDYGRPVYTGAQEPRGPIRIVVDPRQLGQAFSRTGRESARWISPSGAGRLSEADLEPSRPISLTVDGLVGYGVAVVADPSALARANTAADARRAADAERVKARWASSSGAR